ncbi:MAG: hypothetical protein E7H38_07955 [Varibaculum cambriense]|uniref:hypothetical protein n=1 Tax=Varibaculum cambriense TaxID=184870 RepID=UPI0029141A9F|nr:hypothetical protein [Varibaculum cambriense]MDU4028288.1 hypothetical protein [Varibaculum cambriense]
MTRPENNKETVATARQLAKNVYEHAQITLQLSAASRAIEDYFDNPGLKTIEGLKERVSKAGAAARLTAETSDRIRYLSYQLRTLLDQEEGKNE